MRTANIAVLYAPGTNCHVETAHAIRAAGGVGEVLLLSDLLSSRARLDAYQGVVIPGGFSYGDHIAAGRVFATALSSRLKDALSEFLRAGKAVLGICNGDQVLMEAGLLPRGEIGSRSVALTQNRSARFESRVVYLRVEESSSFWMKGMAGKVIRVPVAHAEGRLYHEEGVQVRAAFRYCDENGSVSQDYPLNPAGSPGSVAGVLDSSGRILGMMPHPERALDRRQGSSDGIQLFQNMVEYCRNL